MVADASPTESDPAPMVTRAKEVIAVHAEDADGWCTGCAVEYGFATPHPCTARRWADRTLSIAGRPWGTGT
ncbi:hypothetical protein Cme02nite_31700 [Catellatospora methionotrophica]|uniref:Uncharacterized protein n=1 Tax=Catellatospora methionotrophica TaxID=121620 RepID=A0A8J3PFY2_9ACTN|nr:hypothetical protein Cme02nite_31700 [Catellatospora methionotrophica]